MKRNTNVKENEMSGSDKSERNMSEKMKGGSRASANPPDERKQKSKGKRKRKGEGEERKGTGLYRQCCVCVCVFLLDSS